MNQELKKIMEEQETEPKKVKVKDGSKNKTSRAKKYLILAAVVATVLTAGFALYKINQFFDHNRFQNPIVIRPLIVKRQAVTLTAAASAEVIIDPKELSEKDLMLSKVNGDLMWRVYGIESQFGKNDNCRKSGLYNGFGFNQNSKNWVCYKSFEEVVNAVDKWFTDHKNMSVPESLCFYNLGQPNLRSCEYYQKYLNIKP